MEDLSSDVSERFSLICFFEDDLLLQMLRHGETRKLYTYQIEIELGKAILPYCRARYPYQPFSLQVREEAGRDVVRGRRSITSAELREGDKTCLIYTERDLLKSLKYIISNVTLLCFL